MSTSESVLVRGDISFADLVMLVEPLIPTAAEVTQTQWGYSYPGGYSISDAVINDDWYEDDHGLPLSQYRFDISMDGPGQYQVAQQDWAKRVFELLSMETTLDLIWVGDLEVLRSSRPPLLQAT